MQETSNPKDRLRLADAIREARGAMADRGDFAADAREADLARIEILAQDLQPVFEEVPADDPLWDFAVSKGLQPRLWIDAVSHVAMGRDRRTYRFIRDTRLGRIVVAESSEVRAISDAVTNYIAERLVERRQLMEGARAGLAETGTGAVPPRALPIAPPAARRSRLKSSVSASYWFLIGALAGAAALLMLFWDRLKEFV
ncbi:MAG: hypothetical protein ACRECY_09495 [Phyllobacterium sp.]